MKKMRRGFTLVEVALFLAVTGALFAGILVGTQNSIWQQRYNDAVQNYVDFLKNVYAEVSNPQSIGDGRSDQAIYGKLITFGQTVGVNGETLETGTQKFYVYDVVGDATNAGTGTVQAMLADLNANVVVDMKNDSGSVTGISPAGIIDTYTPIWGASIEETAQNDDNLFKGSILIVRHPRSGTMSTLVSSDVIEVNKEIRDVNMDGDYARINNLLTNELGKFGTAEVDFCLNPYGYGERADMRRDIRLLSNARNASGIELVSLDSDDYKCANN